MSGYPFCLHLVLYYTNCFTLSHFFVGGCTVPRNLEVHIKERRGRRLQADVNMDVSDRFKNIEKDWLWKCIMS